MPPPSSASETGVCRRGSRIRFWARPAGAMPADHRRWLRDHQCAAPIEEPCQYHQADASRRVDPARSDAALDVQSQLLAQEETLGAQGLADRNRSNTHRKASSTRRPAILRRLTMHSWCHGGRPEPVVTARSTGME
jgi:hypothetical protein